MPLHFKTICSSSSGNCLLLWTEDTKIVIDCGLGSMQRTRAVLTDNFKNPTHIDSIIITHTHGDHISYYPLRVMEEYGIDLRIHEDSIDQLKDKHFNGIGLGSLKIKPFADKAFKVGNLTIEPVKVPHHPNFNTYGFVVRYKQENEWLNAVITADFNNGRAISRHLIDADFIYIESNHDLELLKKYPNHNSHYHMSNPNTAKLLCLARKQSRKAPKAVMLGHISNERNEHKIALNETVSAFKGNDINMDFELSAAPLYESSKTIQI